jgi:hypothetical protein
MTDTPALPAPEPEDRPPEPPPPEPRPRRNVVPWFYAFGFLVLAGAIGYLWVNTQMPNGAGGTGQAAPSDDLQAVNQQLQSIAARLTRVEQRPAAADLTARVDALEHRPANTDTSALAARVAALEQRVNADPQLAARVDALAGRIDALSGKAQSGEADLDRRVDALEARLTAATAAAQQVSALNERAARLARFQAATAALEAGQKLGDLPGAPPALSRYAAANPPTEAELRLAFPAVARAAMAASQPDTAGQPFLNRVWLRAETLVTVRQGDEVVVGDAASGVLARAHTALDAGDLAGAVNTLSALKGKAADAVSNWMDDAKGLLAARAALTSMAEQS